MPIFIYKKIWHNTNRKIIYTALLSIKSNNLTKTTNEIKSLLETGEWIYGPKASPTPPDFGNKLSISLKTGWVSVVTLLQVVLQVITFLVPFSIIAVPVGGAIYLIAIYNKKKKNKEKDEEELK